MKAPVKYVSERGQVTWDPPDEEWLRHQHGPLGKSANQISYEVGAGCANTVYRWFELLGVKRVNTVKSLKTKGAPRRRPDRYYWSPPSRKWLEYHYVFLDKSGREIAAEVGATRPTVVKWLRDAGIPIRSSRRLGRGYSSRQARARARNKLHASGVPEVCTRCGRSDCWLDCHHKDGDPFNEGLNNLELLCRSCHTVLHRRGGDSGNAVISFSGNGC